MISYRFRLTQVPPDVALKLIEIDPNQSIRKIKKKLADEYGLNPILDFFLIFQGKILPESLSLSKTGIDPRRDVITIHPYQSSIKEKDDGILKILNFIRENKRIPSKVDLVRNSVFNLDDAEYFYNLLWSLIEYESKEAHTIKSKAEQSIKKLKNPNLYEMIEILGYDYYLAKKVGKYLVDNKWINEFMLVPKNIELDQKDKAESTKFALFKGDRSLKKFKPIDQKDGLLIFMSYCTKDAELFKIKEIAESLTFFNDIYDVLYWQEDVNDNIIKYMSDNLEKCDIILLFCSPNALKSKPIEKEWTAADIMNKPIIPIYIKSDHIPPLLKSRLGVEFDTFDLTSTIDEIYNLILKKAEKRLIDIKELKSDF